MIALVHERKLTKPEYDARSIALGRELDARRNSGWLWLSTQEQVALARLGKALMVGSVLLVLIGLICATIVWALYSNVKGKNSMPAGAGTGG